MLKTSQYFQTILCFSAIASATVNSLTLSASASDRQLSTPSLPQVQLIAGTNVSNGGGTNVSNTTGTNVSNTTGTNVSNTSGTNASNATGSDPDKRTGRYGADSSSRADKILSKYSNALSDYDRAATALANAESNPGSGNRSELINAKTAAASELAKVRAEAKNFVETVKPSSGNSAKAFNPSW
jgi:hypothetical protein